MNNAYHRFIRLPKPVINKVTQRLRLSEYYDALDIFRDLCKRTHQHTFQSNLGYQSELLGIQRRLNSTLKPLGYKLVSKQVPKGIQRAHKVSRSERRWGFERLLEHELKNVLRMPESIQELDVLNKSYQAEMSKERRIQRIKAIQENNQSHLLMPLSKKDKQAVDSFVASSLEIDLSELTKQEM